RGEAGVEREQAAKLVTLQREAAATCAASETLSALDAANAEDALSDALSDAGIDDPWRLTDTLVSAGIGVDFVARVSDAAGPATPAPLRWIGPPLGPRQLSAELRDSTDRMGQLV